MKDSELKDRLQEMESDAFKSLRTALRVPVAGSGYTSIGAMLEGMVRSSTKKIDKFVADNIEGE